MMKVLIPVDGSEGSQITLRWAAQLLKESKTKIDILHVIEETADLRATESLLQNSETVLQDARQFMQGKGFQVKQATDWYGDPATEICRYAETYDIDQIVLSANRRQGLPLKTLGSVSNAVFQQCQVQVLLLESSEKPAFKINHPIHPDLCQVQKQVTNILLPIDGSNGSLEAMEWAGRFLDPQKARLYFLNVIKLEPGVEASLSRFLTSERIITHAKNDLAAWGFTRVNAQSIVDEPVEGICRYAEEQQTDQIILGSFGQGLTKAFMGSVSRGVLKCAKTPVFILKDRPAISVDIAYADQVSTLHLKAHRLKILLPLDGSACAQKTLAWASQFFEQKKTRFHLLYVVDDHPMLPPQVQDFEQANRILHHDQLWLEEREFTVEEVQHKVGNAAEEILVYASEAEIDLIVIGSHGQTGLMQFLLGNVSGKVFEQAQQPVLLLKNDEKSTLRISHLDQIQLWQTEE